MQFESDLFTDIVIIFVAAFVGGSVARVLRLPTLIGYMGVGVLVGPHAFGLIGDVEAVQTLAELGVVLLLFAVGVEISPSDLQQLGRRVVFAALGQLVISGAIGYLTGIALGWSTEQSVVLGMVLSLSSTMVVLKTLTDRGELHSLHGRVMTGMLIIQDLAFIPMIAVLPALGGEGGTLPMDLAIGALKAAAVLIVVFLVGGRIIPWLLRRVALFGTRESFIVTVVGVTMGAAAITQSVGLSAALGAFGAGLALSVSDWTGHRALQEVTPLRDIFAAMFFASLGMLTDPQFLADNAGTVITVILVAVVMKLVLVGGLVRIVGYLPHTALLSAVGMAQIGEFSFILAQTAEAEGVVGELFLPLTIVAAVTTMAITPGFIAGGARLVHRLEGRFPSLRPYLPGRSRSEPAADRAPRLREHVVVAGLGRVGSLIAEELHRLAVPFVGIDVDPVAVNRVREDHGHALHGDCASDVVLEAARIQHARLLVVAIADPVSALVTIQHARRLNPSLHIIGRVGWRQEADAFRALGVASVVWPEMEAALEIMHVTLIDLGFGPQRVASLVRRTRASLQFTHDDEHDHTDPYAGLW
jgi:CPA2 family monovalent cation:H+ antiporter-2